MTEVISAEQEEKTGRAQALLRCYGDTVAANSKLVERAKSSIDDEDMVAFVQVGSDLVTTQCPKLSVFQQTTNVWKICTVSQMPLGFDKVKTGLNYS